MFFLIKHHLFHGDNLPHCSAQFKLTNILNTFYERFYLGLTILVELLSAVFPIFLVTH